MKKIGVLGSGAMGSGIAQVAATAGHEVILFDTNELALEKSKSATEKVLNSLAEKGKMTQKDAQEIKKRIQYAQSLEDFSKTELIIEAIIENLAIKQTVFAQLEKIVSDDCILATNTSSLSVTSIAGACEKQERVIGIHFFNPAPLMPLVEIIPGLGTSEKTIETSKNTIDSWAKVTVIAKDTPGFIVNRVARPFYGESIRLYEEGVADFATIDWALKEYGGFKMGPFELMDYIGNDINYTVTETVFREFFYDPRFKPSFTQKRLVEANRLGRKTGKGYYDYTNDAVKPMPVKDELLGKRITNRVLAMLINEAADALLLGVSSKEELDLAMTKGVNYPKGLLKWADEIGIDHVLKTLVELQEEYGEDRYRPSALLKRMSKNAKSFY